MARASAGVALVWAWAAVNGTDKNTAMVLTTTLSVGTVMTVAPSFTALSLGSDREALLDRPPARRELLSRAGGQAPGDPDYTPRRFEIAPLGEPPDTFRPRDGVHRGVDHQGAARRGGSPRPTSTPAC